MSSKMRLMRILRNSGEVTNKMRSNMEITQQQQQGNCNSSSCSNNNSTSDVMRACSHCSTTKTPLWRGEPKGPKSLCNARRIRQRKARKAMAAAAAEEAMNEVLIPKESLNTKVMITGANKEKGSDGDKNTDVVPYKKRCKLFSSEAEEKLKLEDEYVGIGFSRSSDMKEPAILLMDLSSDVIHG